jgi:hypothetical protein
MGSECTDPRFLDLGTIWRLVSASRPDQFNFGERASGVHWIGEWVHPRAGLNDMEKLKFFTLSGLKLPTLRSFSP